MGKRFRPTRFADETPPVSFDMSGGLVGAPIPASRAGMGCRVYDNACLSESGMSVVTQPGFWRSFRQKLRTLTDTQIRSEKIIVACKAEDAIGVHGTCFIWVDASLPAPYARVLSMGYNPNLAPEYVGGGWDPTTDDFFVLSDFGGNGFAMGRLGPHEYPSRPISSNGATYFHDSRSVPGTAKSGAFRKSVPTNPTRKPVLLAAADLRQPCNRMHAGTETLTAVSGNATVALTNAYPHWNIDNAASYNRFTALATDPKSNLCYRNKFFRFIKSERPRTPRVVDAATGDDDTIDTGYGIETSGRVYRVVNYYTCIEPHTFTGTGTDNLEIGGTYNGTVDAVYQIRFTAASIIPNPDEYNFRKSLDGGSTWTAWSAGIAITAANRFQFLDNSSHSGSDGIRIRFTTNNSLHNDADVYEFEAHYVGEGKPGDPTKTTRIGDGGFGSASDASCRIKRITRGKSGVGGRRIYRTGPGPFWNVDSGSTTGTINLTDDDNDPEGNVGIGVHKWAYSFLVPDIGEGPLSPVQRDPEENKYKKAVYLLTNIKRCPTLAKATVDAASTDDFLVEGRYTAGEPDDDYEIIIRITVDGGGGADTMEWLWNGVVQASMACPTADTPLGATGLSFQFGSASGHSLNDQWVINRAGNLISRRIYRSNGGGIYRQVGEIPHNRGTIINADEENHFIDNVTDEDWAKGKLAPEQKDLNFHLIATITDNTTTSYIDRVRTLNVGAKLDYIPDAVDHNRVVMEFKYETADTRPGMVLEPNTIAFIAASGPNLSGDIKEVSIDRAMQAGDWEMLDLYWPHGQFEARSYGFRLMQRDKSYTSVVNPQFSVGSIYINRAKYGPFTKDVGACFSFKQKETKVETNSSPPAPTINLGDDPSGLMLLVHGYRGFWDNAGNSFADDPVGLNKPPDDFKNCGVYVTVRSWGTGDDGNAIYRLVAEDMTYSGTSADTPADYLDRSILIGSKFSPFLGEANSYSVGTSIAVETENGFKEDLAQDIKNLFLSAPLHNFKLRKPSCKFAVLGERRIFSAGEEDFLIGELDLTKYKDIAVYKTESFTRRTVGSGLTDLTITGNWGNGTVQDVYFKISVAGATDEFRFKIGAGGAYSASTAMTGAGQALAGTDGLSVTWAATTGHTLNNEFRTTTSKLEEYLQGRTMIINSSDTDYNNPSGAYPTKQRKFFVVQVIDDITMRIGSDFNRQTETYKENFYGTTGSYGFKIEGRKTSVFATVETKLLGANMDYTWALHEYQVPIVNDKITGLGYAGNYLLAFAKDGVWRTLQNRGIEDDSSGGPAALSEWDDIHGAPGCIADRTINSLPGGRIIWFTPDYRVAIGSANGFEFFEGKDKNRPISARIKTWIETNVDPELVKYAHAYYEKKRDRYHIHFIANDSVSGSVPDGSTIDVTTPTTDFYYRLTVDLRFGVVYPATRVRISANMTIGQDTVSDQTSPAKVIGGDIFGYLNELDDATAQCRGVTKGDDFEYTITGYAGGVFTVTPATLPTTDDDLIDVEFRIEDSSGNQEWLRVASNTGNTITPAVAPVLVPASGDELLLGPISPDLRGMEMRFIDPAVIHTLRVDTHDPAGGNPQQYRFTVYGAEDDDLYTEGNAQTLTTFDFTEDDLKQGQGGIWPDKVPRRSLQAGLSWTQRSSPVPTELLGVHLFVRTGERDRGRSFDYA